MAGRRFWRISDDPDHEAAARLRDSAINKLVSQGHTFKDTDVLIWDESKHEVLVLSPFDATRTFQTQRAPSSARRIKVHAGTAQRFAKENNITVTGDFKAPISASTNARIVANEIRTRMENDPLWRPTEQDLRNIVKEKAGNLGSSERLDLHAEFLEIQEEYPGRLSANAVARFTRKDVQEKIDKGGGDAGLLYARRGDTLTPKEVDLADDLGVEVTDNVYVTRQRIRAALRARDAEQAGNQAALKRATSLDKTESVKELNDLTLVGGGIGDAAVRELETAGITITDLKAARVSEKRLLSLPSWGPKKVEALRKAGFQVKESREKRPGPGRPKKVFGGAKDPFARTNPALVGTTTQRVRDSSGALVEREVPSLMSQWADKWVEAWKATVGRPFVYASQYADREDRRLVKEANAHVRKTKAERYLRRVKSTDSTLKQNFWRASFYGERSIMFVLMAALTVGVLFVPIGILSVGAWFVTATVAFLLNGGMLVGFGIIANVASAIVNGLNYMGIVVQNLLQAGINQLPDTLGTKGGTLPEYQSVNFQWATASPLDPNALFPTCINNNSAGSLMFSALGSGLNSFGGWVAANGEVAVALLLFTLIAVPFYFIHRGIALGAAVATLGTMLFQSSGSGWEFSIPLWAIAVGAITLVGLLFFVFARPEARTFGGMFTAPGAIAMFLGIGLVGAGLTGVIAGKDFFEGKEVVFERNEITVTRSTIGEGAGSFVKWVGSGATFLAAQMKTGWNQVLNPERFVTMANLFNLGEAADVNTVCEVA